MAGKKDGLAMKNADDMLSVMCAAHERGDVDAVRELLASYPALETMGPDDNHIPWLHWAAEHGQIAVIEFWLERGCDVNLGKPGDSKAKGLVTALHAAKDAATTRYLLARGALVNACHRDFGSPLHHAITRALEPSQKGRPRPEGANMDQVRALIDAGADLTLMNGEGNGFTPLAWAMQLKRKTAEKLLRELGAPERGTWPKASKSKVKPLDLQQDFAAVYDYVAQRVRDFEPQAKTILGAPGDVKFCHVGYEAEQAGWVALVFDTRAGAQIDGEWTAKIPRNQLKMPHWKRAVQANCEQPLPLILIDGAETSHAVGEELAVPLGQMITAALIKLRAEGVFETLPLTPDCQLSVEHFDGAYGWAESAHRGR